MVSTQFQQITIYTDGGSRGNPGPAAAAFILEDKDKNQIQAKAVYLGSTTNNVAEYSGLLNALEAARQIGAQNITVFSDSELIVRQINGQYKVKSKNLQSLFNRSIELLDTFQSSTVNHISRDKNTTADTLVNLALDKKTDIDQSAETKQINTQDNPCAESKNQLKTKRKPIRLGVLISGGGTTLINILEIIKQGKLNAQVALVISSRSTVAGVERVKKAGLDVKIICKKDFPDIDEFSNRIEEELVKANVDLVVQGGWLCLWKIPSRYESRVMNIHPALLPSFGGQGMWGHHVHEAVLKAGCKISGCTVHFCTNEYDKGPIIVQRACKVEENDSPDTLAARVFEQECIAYPEAIRLFEEGKILVKDGKIKIKQ